MWEKKPKVRDAYRLTIDLCGASPRIWRCVEVGADTTLHKLHWVIQQAMGWTNSHLHQFIIGNVCFSQPEHDPDGEMDWLDEHVMRLREAVWQVGSVFAYEYDFGDSWTHHVSFEGFWPRQKGVSYPRCTDGAGACPPEDCGGVSGYEAFLAAIRDPTHPDHDQLVTWAGGPFDPAAFSLIEANERLAPLARRKSLDRTYRRHRPR